MLKDTRAIQMMNIHIGLYDPTQHPSEAQDIIESINRTVLQILRRVSRMKLQRLEITTGQDTARIADIVSVMEQNDNKLNI